MVPPNDLSFSDGFGPGGCGGTVEWTVKESGGESGRESEWTLSLNQMPRDPVDTIVVLELEAAG